MKSYILKKSCKTRKQQFTLIEVVVAIALIAMTLAPLMYPHFSLLREERSFIQEVRLDTLSNVLYTEVLERFYKGQVPWSQISTKDAPIRYEIYDSVELERSDYRAFWTAYTVRSKPKQTPRYHLVEIDMIFTDRRLRDEHIFPYFIVVDRQLAGFVEEEEEPEDDLPEEDEEGQFDRPPGMPDQDWEDLMDQFRSN